MPQGHALSLVGKVAGVGHILGVVGSLCPLIVHAGDILHRLGLLAPVGVGLPLIDEAHLRQRLLIAVDVAVRHIHRRDGHVQGDAGLFRHLLGGGLMHRIGQLADVAALLGLFHRAGGQRQHAAGCQRQHP